MRRFDRRGLWLWAGRLALGLLLLALPWPGVNAAFVAGYSKLVDALVLDHLTFGRGGHARLRPALAVETRTDQNVVSDAVIALRVDGYSDELKIAMSLRRDAYLPICVLLAVIAAAPLPWRRRGRALGWGLPAIIALTVVCQWFGILWTFSQQLAPVMAWGPGPASLIDGLYQALLLPPSNRFVVPLLLGSALVVLSLSTTA